MGATTKDWVRRTLAENAPSDEECHAGAVGDLELAPFQARAVRRGTEIVRRYGGILVADAVGLGKTRVTLGIAESLAGPGRVDAPGRSSEGGLLVCVPARLREQWRRKLRAAGFEAFRLLTHTAMSRGAVDTLEATPQMILVDEAHRFRNPDAARSRALARLAAARPVVMATATPVCNSVWDLYHLLSLFLAEHDLRQVVGYDLSDAFERAEEGAFDLTELVEEVVIRRVTPPEEGAFRERPATRLRMLEYEAEPDEAWIWSRLEGELRSLQFAAFGDEWPRELFIEYTLRRWESGSDALKETLERIREFHRRWLEARHHGRTLDRADFRSLFEAPSALEQEVFPFLFRTGDGGEDSDQNDVEAVEADLEVIEVLDERVGRVVDGRRGPVDAVGRLAARLDDRLLVFTRYRRAARGLFESLRARIGSRGRLGLATGDGAWATGLGRTEMDEILRRFAPRSYGEDQLAPHHQIRVLVATDCLSEGVNLQDCGHVVLADLPYSALVVEQRIGRLVRPGSRHETVQVYLPRPANWSDTLGLRRRLRRKMSEAELSGVAFTASGLELLENGSEQSEVAENRQCGVAAAGGPAGRRAGEAQSNGSGFEDERLGAAQMGRPSEPASPLAAMTKLDALREQLGLPEAPLEKAFWRTVAPVREACLWLGVERKRGSEVSMRWVLVREGASIEYRRARIVRALVALADAELPLERSEPPAELLRRAEDWLEERLTHLRAVLLAPTPVGWDAPQFRLWRRFRAWFEGKGAGVVDCDPERLRRRLLRPFPSGARRRLEELAEEDASPERLLPSVLRLVDAAVPGRPEVDFSIRSGLHLLPRPP